MRNINNAQFILHFITRDKANNTTAIRKRSCCLYLKIENPPGILKSKYWRWTYELWNLRNQQLLWFRLISTKKNLSISQFKISPISFENCRLAFEASIYPFPPVFSSPTFWFKIHDELFTFNNKHRNDRIIIIIFFFFLFRWNTTRIG